MQTDLTSGEKFDYSDALMKIDNIRESILKLQKEINNSSDSYKKYYKEKEKIISADDSLKKADKLIKDAYDKLNTTLTETFNSINADKTNELLTAIVFYDNNKEAIYTSLPIQFKGEQAKLDITILPRKDEYLLQSFRTKLLFPLGTKQYFAVAVSFYWATSLNDDSYSIVGTPTSSTSTVYKIVKENIPNSEIGMASLIHFGWKLNDEKTFGLHFSFGPGVSISKNIKPRLLIGGGLTYGNKQMLALNLGMALGYVDRLSDTIDSNQNYSQKPDNISVSKLQTGFFISVAYLFNL
jgi:hypothetical protein